MNSTNSTSRKHKQAQHPNNPALLSRHLSFSCFRSLITFNGILNQSVNLKALPATFSDFMRLNSIQILKI